MLRDDRPMRWTLLVAGLVSIPLFVGAIPESVRVLHGRLLDLPLFAIAIGSLWRLRGETPQRERAFATLLICSLAAWPTVHVLEQLVPRRLLSLPLPYMLDEAFYLAFYLLLLFALEQRPHLRSPIPTAAGVRLEHLAAVVLAAGLWTYFLVIPAILAPDSLLDRVPSYLLYVAFDAYMVVRLVASRAAAAERRWRSAYGWMLGATAGWLVLDLYEGLLEPGLEILGPGTPGDALWLLPLASMIAGVRTLRAPVASWQAESYDLAQLRARRREGALVLFTFVLPAAHLIMELTEVLDPATAKARQITVVVTFATLSSLAVLYDRRRALVGRRLEEDRRRLAEELALSQRMESVRRFAGGLAHDFNNKLLIIRGYAELLETSLREHEPERADARRIIEAADAASSLTGQLLRVSRREKDRIEPTSINETLSRIATVLPRVLDQHIHHTFVLDPRAGHVLADPNRLEDAILNLVLNARDAMPAGGRLVLRSSQTNASARGNGDDFGPDRYGVIEVEDSGSGMDEETRRHAFEPFFTTKPTGRGTGLGLAMVYSSVAQSGGRIEIDSEVGQGTIIRILLPATDAAAAPPAIRQVSVVAPSPASRLLVVEDEDAVRAVVVRTLRDAGYQVSEAANGREALRRLVTVGEEVDLVLTDVVMPEMGGGELAAALREHRPHLPLLFMTGYQSDGLSRHGFDGSRVKILEKPFRGDQLTRAVREALETAPAAR